MACGLEGFTCRVESILVSTDSPYDVPETTTDWSAMFICISNCVCVCVCACVCACVCVCVCVRACVCE